MSKQHGTYWVVKEGQDTSGAVTSGGYGKPNPDNLHTVPLQTVEAKVPFSETTERIESVRYFERKK